MKTHFDKYKLFLILGIFFLFCGSNLLVIIMSPLSTLSYLLAPTALLIIGLSMLILSLTGKRRTFFTFTGLFFCCGWLLLLLVSSHIIPFTIIELWPLMVILSGIMLVPVGFLRYGFLPISFFVSACMLLSFGVLFLLFSLDIIRMSITQFASRWWPLLFILSGISLIGLFFYTRKHEKQKWVKNSDDDED